MKRFAMSLLLFGIFVSPMFAHHGTAPSYDESKVVTLKGTVAEFRWANPHVQLYWNVTDDHGNVVRWGGEMASPAVLSRRGYNRNTLKPGDQITVTVSPSKVGNPVGLVGVITLADGTVLQADQRVPKVQ